MAGIVAVMKKAAKEAGGSSDFTNNIKDKTIDWQGGLSGDLGDTLPTDDGIRVRINIIAIYMRFGTYFSSIKGHMDFADVIAHEMEHVRRFKCGEESPTTTRKPRRTGIMRGGRKRGTALGKAPRHSSSSRSGSSICVNNLAGRTMQKSRWRRLPRLRSTVHLFRRSRQVAAWRQGGRRS
jgi:hypothetical protein